MRVVPGRSPWLQLLTVFAAMLLGPLAALRLGMFLTPTSDLVQTLGVLAFGLILIGGATLWMGLGVATAVVSGLWKLMRGKGRGVEGNDGTNQLIPAGYRSFVVLGVVVGFGMGLLAGLATELSLSTGVRAWTLLGLAYGLALWAAAHHGYLPFPEPE